MHGLGRGFTFTALTNRIPRVENQSNNTIDIVFTKQDEAKTRKLFFVLGLCSLLGLISMVFIPEFRSGVAFWWFIAFMAIHSLQGILWGLGKGNWWRGSAAFLRINDQEIEFNNGTTIEQKIRLLWQDVKNIEVRLFELAINTSANQSVSIPLSSLTDENRIAVKEFIQQVKNVKGI